MLRGYQIQFSEDDCIEIWISATKIYFSKVSNETTYKSKNFILMYNNGDNRNNNDNENTTDSKKTIHFNIEGTIFSFDSNCRFLLYGITKAESSEATYSIFIESDKIEIFNNNKCKKVTLYKSKGVNL